MVELLILYERWAGERLVLEMSLPKQRRFGRSLSVSAVPSGEFGALAGFWVPCFRLCFLGRFLPCRSGANHCRPRSIGWERCGHGLTSRPLEASDSGFLDDLLSLFGYSSGSGESLVDGSLRMRYCSTNFLQREAYMEVAAF